MSLVPANPCSVTHKQATQLPSNVTTILSMSTADLIQILHGLCSCNAFEQWHESTQFEQWHESIHSEQWHESTQFEQWHKSTHIEQQHESTHP